MRLYIVEFDRQITYNAVLVGITSVSCNMCVQLYMTTSPSSTVARLYTMLWFVLIQQTFLNLNWYSAAFHCQWSAIPLQNDYIWMTTLPARNMRCDRRTDGWQHNGNGRGCRVCRLTSRRLSSATSVPLSMSLLTVTQLRCNQWQSTVRDGQSTRATNSLVAVQSIFSLVTCRTGNKLYRLRA